MSELVPRLRFKSFTEHSFSTTLGSLINTSMGFAFKSSDFANTGTQLIRMSNLYQGTLTLSRSPVYLPNEFKSNHSKYIVKKGDLLMSMTGTVGKRDYGYVIKVNESADFFLNQRVMKISVKQQASQDYIQYLLTDERFLNRLYSLPGGTKQANLSADQLKSISITVPANKQEQQKIADFLTSVDTKISQLTEKHRLLKEYKKGVMQQIFSQKIRFKDDNGEAFPEWDFKPLSELAFKPNQKNKDHSVKRVLTNSAKKGIMLQSDYFDKDIAKEDNTENYYVVEVNDFVYNPRISELAPVGPISRNKIAQGVMSPLYTVFRFTKSVDLEFIELFFTGDTWHHYMYSVANFGARHDRMNISSNDFMSLPCPFPCIAEQQKIAQYLQAIDAKIYAVNQQVEDTKQFKKGLLQQMFV